MTALDLPALAPPAADPSRPAPPRPGARSSAWTAILCLIAAIVTAPGGAGLLGPAAFARVIGGEVEIRSGQDWQPLGPGDTVPADTDLRTTGGAARLRAAAGDLRLAAGTAVTTGRRGDVALLRGSVLLEATGTMAVRVGTTEARGRGSFRADVGPASRVAVYQGRVTLADGVTDAELTRFQQVSVRDGAVAAPSRPLRYLATDIWDTELLADAIAVDRLVAGAAVSLAAQYGREPQPESFYAAFGPAQVAARAGELASVVRDGRVGPPADVLAGIAVVDAIVREVRPSAGTAVDRVTSLRRAGAAWGLVLLHHDLGPRELRAALGRLLTSVDEAGTEPVPSGTDVAPEADTPTPDPAPAAADAPVDPVTTPTATPRDGRDEDDGAGAAEGPPDPVDDLLDATDRAIQDTDGTLDEAVDGVGEPPSPGETIPLLTD